MNAKSSLLGICTVSLAVMTSIANGQGAIWTNSNPGNLLTNSNWDTGSAPNGVGALARITASSPTNAGDFSLNGNMTLGELRYANNNNGKRSVNGTGTLTMQASGSTPALIWVTDASGGLNLNQSQIRLNSNTEFRIATSSEWNAQITGSRGFELTGGGNLRLTNRTHNYQGATTITSGTLFTEGEYVLPATTDVQIASGGEWWIRGNNGGAGGRASQSIRSLTIADGGNIRFLGNSNSFSVAGRADLGSFDLGGATDSMNFSFGSLYMNGGTIFTWSNITVGTDNQLSHIKLDPDVQHFSAYSFKKVGSGHFIHENGKFSGDNGLDIEGGVYEFRGNAGWDGGIRLKNNAILRYNVSAPVYEIAAAILGDGNVDITGTAVCNFIDDSTFTGTLTISNGVSQIGNGGTGGSIGTGNIVNNAVLRFNRINTLLLGNQISGTGQVVQVGTGTTVLTGANNYSGTTTITTGTLQVGNGSTTGTLGTGAVVNNGQLVFNRSNNLLIANSISGTGSINKLGAGTTTLTAANTYSGTTTITAGTLQVGNGSTTGTLGTGAVVNDSNLVFNRSNNFVVANAISGTGSISKLGAGIMQLTGTNSYSGTTTIAAGTLRVGVGGTTGTLGTGAVVNQGLLQFFRSDALSVSSAISGTGTVEKIGAGTTTLTAANTYSGTTFVSGGALQIGNGGTTGTLGTGGVVNNASLIFNRSNDLAVSNAISGTGSLTKLGTGTTWLTGPLTYSGATNVQAGTLVVNGQHLNGQQYTAHAGASLAGTGRIGSDVTIESNAILEPGNFDAGTLRMDGSLLLAGIYRWELKDYTSADLTAVLGNLNISGTLSAIVSPNLTLQELDKYTLFAYQGNLSGEFVNQLNGWQINYADLTPGRNGYSGTGQFKYVTLTATAVPEPASSTAALALGALLISLWRRRV